MPADTSTEIQRMAIHPCVSKLRAPRLLQSRTDSNGGGAALA